MKLKKEDIMKMKRNLFLVLIVCLLVSFVSSAFAASTLKRVGVNPFYRPPLTSEADLRALVKSRTTQIRTGFAKAGYPNLYRDFSEQFPGATIDSIKVSPGETFKWMLFRKKGSGPVIVTKDVTWGGVGPLDAYRFYIDSKDKRYEFAVLNACGNFSLKKITEKEKIKIDSESLGILSVLAEGSLRDAQSMLDQVLSFSEGSVDATQVRDIFGLPSRERINGMVESFLRKDAKTSFKIVREAMAENMDSAALFKLLIRNFRFLIYLKIDREFEEELKKYISEAEMAFFKKITSEFEVNDMEKILIELNFAYSNLNWAYLPELPLELAILKISQI